MIYEAVASQRRDLTRPLILWAAFAWVWGVATANAHVPYLGPPLSCHGQSFEVRFLYGDGILGPDPRSLVVLDAETRLLAIQPVGIGTYPILGFPCRFWDPVAGGVYEPVPDSFSLGPGLIGEDEQSRANRRSVEPFGRKDDAQWGFHVQDNAPSRPRRIVSEVAYRWRFLIGTSGALVAAMGLLVMSLFTLKFGHPLAGVMLLVTALPLAFFVGGVTILLFAFEGVSNLFAALSVAVAITFGAIVFRVLQRNPTEDPP